MKVEDKKYEFGILVRSFVKNKEQIIPFEDVDGLTLNEIKELVGLSGFEVSSLVCFVDFNIDKKNIRRIYRKDMIWNINDKDTSLNDILIDVFKKELSGELPYRSIRDKRIGEFFINKYSVDRNSRLVKK